jgi:DNA modification methylase
LAVLRAHVPDASIDLVYLDPPFNSQREYRAVPRRRRAEGRVEEHAFEDRWAWDDASREALAAIIGPGTACPPRLVLLMDALRAFIGEGDMLSYLAMMALRLVELHRVLSPTGSLYLHCDPTAGHYLKLVLDAVFGPEGFRNEIVWQRFGAKNDPCRYGRVHDVLLFYARGRQWTYNPQFEPIPAETIAKNYTAIEPDTGRRYQLSDLTASKGGGDTDYTWHGVRPYPGRHWAFSRDRLDQMLAEGRIVFRRTGMPRWKRYLDEMPGVALQDVWTDIRLSTSARERIGYPTQKPLALLERIIAASSNEGDWVLDPFVGSGTTLEAAERLGRRWIGVDVAEGAIALASERLATAFPDRAERYAVVSAPFSLGCPSRPGVVKAFPGCTRPAAGSARH